MPSIIIIIIIIYIYIYIYIYFYIGTMLTGYLYIYLHNTYITAVRDVCAFVCGTGGRLCSWCLY